jgi:hypothetical protein
MSSGFIIIFGIFKCGVLKNTRREYSVIEGSAATSGNLGAAGLAEIWFGLMAWHWEHHLSANTSPRWGPAYTLPATASAPKKTINATTQPFFLMLTLASHLVARQPYHLGRQADEFASTVVQ